MRRTLVLITAIFIAIFLGTALRRCTTPAFVTDVCTHMCDLKGRRLASVNESGFIATCNCGAKIFERSLSQP